jgi:hypothetical protein
MAGGEAMRRILVLGLLSSAASLAQEEALASSRGHFYFGPGLQVAYSGSSSQSLIFALHAMGDTGDWMIGADARAGILRSPSFVLGFSARIDRFLYPAGDSFYAGGTLGLLDEFDGENFGGDGAFVGAQAGFLWGRERRWGRVTIELQVSIPLFGERPNKPGNYVYRFATLGLRLLL